MKKDTMKSIGKGLIPLLVFLGIQIGITFVIAIIYGIIAGVNATQNIENDSIFNSVCLSVSSVFTILWGYFYIKKHKDTYKYTSKADNKLLIMCIVLGIVIGFAVDFNYLNPSSLEQASSYMKSIMGTLFLAIATVCILGPITEEIIFRGLMYNDFKKGMSVPAAIVLSSILFGIVHGSGGILYIISAGLTGAVLAYIFQKTNSLVYTIAIHITNNVCATIYQYLNGYSLPFVTQLIINIITITLTIIMLIFINRYFSYNEKTKKNV